MSKNYSKIQFNGTHEEFEKQKELYKNFDIVYYKRANVGIGHHEIIIYKQPEGIGDWDLAVAIDGFFWSVDRYGDTLDCWYD